MRANIDQIQKQGFFISTAIADQVLLQLNQLDNFNQAVQKKKQFYGKITLAYCIGGVISGGLFFFAPLLFGGLVNRLVPFFGFLLVICVVGIVVFSTIANRFQKLTLPTYRYELAKSTIDVLGRDMDKYSMVSLSLGFQSDSRPVHTTTHPRKSGWRIDSYCDQFLKLDGKFQDGTIFSIKFQERVREKKGRNINGKFRVKPVNKGMDIIINLRVRRPVYGSLTKFQTVFSEGETAINAHRLLNLPKNVLKKLKFKGQTLILVINIADATPLRWAQPVAMGANKQLSLQMSQIKMVHQIFVTALLSCYQILNLSRMIKEEAI